MAINKDLGIWKVLNFEIISSLQNNCKYNTKSVFFLDCLRVSTELMLSHPKYFIVYFLQIWTFSNITPLLPSESEYCRLILRLHLSFVSCPVNMPYSGSIRFRNTYCVLLSCLSCHLQPRITPQSFLDFYDLDPFEDYRPVTL